MLEPFRLSFLKALWIIISIMLCQLVIGIITYPLMHWLEVLSPNALTFVSELLNIACYAFVVYVFYLSRGYHLSFAKIKGKLSHKALWLLLMTIGAILVIEPFMAFLLEYVTVSPILVEMMDQAKAQPVAMFFVIVISAPVIEELMFRGVLLKGLSEKYGVKWGIILSALLFGLFHLNWHQMLTATVVGLIYGWVATETKSVRYTILLHAMNNAMVFVFGDFSFVNLTKSYLVSFALGLMLVTGLMVMFHRLFETPQVIGTHQKNLCRTTMEGASCEKDS